MRKISLDGLEPGMRLAKPVLNGNGMVLVSEDTELTDLTIDKLKHMDVDSVYVQGPAEQAKPKEEMLHEFEERFGNAEGAPYMDLIKKAVREHIEGLYEQA